MKRRSYAPGITYMGISGPSLLIESTDSMIHVQCRYNCPPINKWNELMYSGLLITFQYIPTSALSAGFSAKPR